MRVCFNDAVCSDYSTKIEKEKREHAKQHGMIRTEITGAEIAEEMEKERHLFQLQMCEVRTDLPTFCLEFHSLSSFVSQSMVFMLTTRLGVTIGGGAVS